MICGSLLRTLFVTSSVANAYKFTATGRQMCGCAATGTDVKVFAKCVSDAVAGSKCNGPEYSVDINYDNNKEYCVGTDGTAVLATNPKVDLQVLTAFQLGTNDGCKIASVQLGNVPTDGSVSNGTACSAFVKTRELNFKAAPGSSGETKLTLDKVHSAEGNAVLVSGTGCTFGAFSAAHLQQDYGSTDAVSKLVAGAAGFVGLIMITQML